MSQAFVKENEEQWLHDVSPTIGALINYLTHENNGVRVYQQKSMSDENGLEVYTMSNGMMYSIGQDGKWTIVW